VKIRTRDRSYFLNLLLAIDQLISAICNYNADTSVSAALGEIQWLEYGGANIPFTSPLKAVLQRGLDKAKPYHCLKSYRYELEKRNQVSIIAELNRFIKE